MLAISFPSSRRAEQDRAMIIFKSAATADLMMFGDVATRLLELMGKESTEKGIITSKQLPDAIARLEGFMVSDRERHRDQVLASGVAEIGGDGDEEPGVSLTHRALPLLEMLQVSLKENKPVVWGV